MAIDKCNPTERIITVTPELARKWLEKNTANRGLRPSRVRYFAKLIENNEFMLTHQGIAFAKDGTLIDGQHRLAAIAAVGKPVRMFVGEGFVREDVILAIDIGSRRNTADSLRLKNGGDPLFNNTTVSIYREFVRVCQKNRVIPTEAEIERFCFANEDLLNFAKHIKTACDHKASSPVLLALVAAKVNDVSSESLERLVKLIYKNQIDVFVKAQTNTAILNAAGSVRNVRQTGDTARENAFCAMKNIIYTHQRNLIHVPKNRVNLYPITIDKNFKLVKGE